MGFTQNSISAVLAQFLRLQKNSIEIINGLNEVATSTNDTVQIEVLDESGLPMLASVPGYGYMRSQIQRLDSNIQALSGLGDSFSTVRNPDGTYSQIYKSQPVKDPIALKNLQIPNTFRTRDNWFFESFLSPLLYVSVDVTGQMPDDSDRVRVKRIIANTETDEKKAYFDQNLKGRNDITESDFVKKLNDGGIIYFIDEDNIDLPLRTIRNKGNFGVVSFYDDIVSLTDSNGVVTKETRRNYKLTSLKYTDTISDIENGRTIDIGNILLTSDGSRYEITAINIQESSVQLKRTSGYQPVQIGANSLTLLSTQFSPREIQVNVGFDERQGIFFKKIDDNYNIIGSTWSPGIIFYSNELTINTTNGVQTLEQFYLTSVADLGQIFLGMVKEKKIGAINALKPDSPTIDPNNFKVVQINKQLTKSVNTDELNSKISLKSTLQSEISQLDKSISEVRSKINSASDSSVGSSNSGSVITSGRQSGTNVSAMEANLNSLTGQRVQNQELLATTIDDISTAADKNPQINVTPKYRVRGFWPIPAPKISQTTGTQSIIQFIKQYRYLSDSGVASPVDELSYTDSNGQKKSGAFSNWNEIKSAVRKKVYNSDSGTYEWAHEATTDADVLNINQLDIPITKGEKVEIRIQAVSEAGWPDNPSLSDFSESVIITFPDNATVQSLNNSVSANLKDQAVLAIQKDLSSKGIDGLLSRQFTAGSKTYYMDSAAVASGFYDSSGLPLDLFRKLTELQDQINSLNAAISKAAGILEVYLIDGNSNSQLITNGSSITLNGGYYNQLFSAPTTTDAGKIASQIYELKIINGSAGLLELSSILPGGLDTLAGSSSAYTLPSGYSTNLKYGETPISITSLTTSDIIPVGSTGGANEQSFQLYRQTPPFASSNSNSQFIYPRWKSVGFDSNLYTSTSAFNSAYSYVGDSSGLPRNGSQLLPFDPTSTSVPTYSGTGANVWNGTVSGSIGSYTWDGNGPLSEFCIHKDHPASETGLSFTNLIKPDFSGSGNVVYPYFRHSDYFYIDSTIPNFYSQLGYSVVATDFVQGATAARQDSMYPQKLGFTADDEYLIGRYTCGAYLFLGPPTSSTVQVEGSSQLASKFVNQGDANSISIPLIFQFRATDKLGNIGGFRSDGNPTNITYTKKIGIDIQVRNQSPFSFDVQVTGKYKNDTLSSPNFSTTRAI